MGIEPGLQEIMLRLRQDSLDEGYYAGVKATIQAVRTLLSTQLGPAVDALADAMTPPASMYLSGESSLAELGLDQRLLNVLGREGYDTIGDVMEKTKGQLMDVPLFGAKSYPVLQSALARHGFLHM